MGRWRALIPITIALVISLITSLYLHKRLKAPDGTDTQKSSDYETAAVAVAAEDLAPGAKIQPEMLKTASYLKKNLPPDSIADPESLAGRVVISSIRKNEPIVEHRLAPKTFTLGGVSAVVKFGRRAIAVKGDKVIGISGFILPGNRVDVLVTVDDPDRKMEVTKTVLENIPVLATGTLIQKSEKGNNPVDVYTLEVTPENGEKLALAAAKGRLQFALRNAEDTQNVVTDGVTIPQLLSSLLRPEPKPKTESANQGSRKPAKRVNRVLRRSRFTMEVIKGGKVITQRFKR